MLQVFLATALSVAALSADSVRTVAKAGTARPDSTLLSLPAPSISVPSQPAAPVPGPIALIAAMPTPMALEIITAPADASAVVRSTRPPVPMTTADGRTVLGTKTTITVEPLHAVPLPAVHVRTVAPSVADSIVVYKRERTMILYHRGVPVRSYFIALGGKPTGDKERAGDQRTPEGLYSIDAHNPASKFHLALRISYPNAVNRARAEALGVDPGGDIMIHGLPKEYSSAGKEHRLDDWTNGCVALTNEEIEEVWRAVPDGTPVQIKP